MNLEKRIRAKHLECKENPTRPKALPLLGEVEVRRKRGPASVTGLAHKNEIFPKIKKGRSRRGRERNVLNRPEYKETAGLSALPSSHPATPASKSHWIHPETCRITGNKSPV